MGRQKKKKKASSTASSQLASASGLGRVALKRPSWRPLLLFGPLEKMQRLGQLGPSVGQWPHRGSSSSDGSFTALYSYCSMEPLAHPKMEIRVQKAYCDPRLGNIDIPCPLAVSVSSCHPQPHHVPLSLPRWLGFVRSLIDRNTFSPLLPSLSLAARASAHSPPSDIIWDIDGEKMW